MCCTVSLAHEDINRIRFYSILRNQITESTSDFLGHAVLTLVVTLVRFCGSF